jgi:hypothetical protein
MGSPESPSQDPAAPDVAEAARPRARRAGETDRSLPNVIVIGAQKCGTSSLHYYLGLHPEVAMSEPKELNFFQLDRNWGKGLDWYRQHFDASASRRGESSPNYTNFTRAPGVPERMASVIPDAKLIYLVRDPIDRIAAHWVHHRASGLENLEMPAALHGPIASYVDRSRYAMQLERYLEYFPRDQILVVDSDKLLGDRLATLREVFEFLDVDAGFVDPGFTLERHESSRKRRRTPLGKFADRVVSRRLRRVIPRRARSAVAGLAPMSEPITKPHDLREKLGPEIVEVLHGEADRLRAITGLDFAGWSV